MINLGVSNDFTDKERLKLVAGCKAVNSALADPSFLAILRASVFANTKDTNDQITAKLTAAITISRLYCKNLSWWATHVYGTIAYESSDGSITFNRYFFDGQSIPSIANTLFHETCHKAGYGHRTSKDYLSVPYEAGNEMEAYLKNKIESYLMDNALSPVV